MRYRRFGRLGWQVSEVGYGMWGVAGGEGGWTGSTLDAGMESLHHAIAGGCNFFDTAWIYGRGGSERMLGRALRDHPEKKLYVATKVPPKNRVWPSRRGSDIEDIFPAPHIHEYVGRSLECLGTDAIDLLQFHVWEDAWAAEEGWRNALEDLKRQGMIGGVGISVNRWEPANVLDTLRTGLIDSVQVIYNIFDQAPEDALFPLCRELDIGVIARVPFDEGSLTGMLRETSTWPDGDWRASYFVPENLVPTVARVDALRAGLPAHTNLANTALRFILASNAVGTVIPGMRSIAHVDANLACSGVAPLEPSMLDLLRRHRWDREPTWWSQ